MIGEFYLILSVYFMRIFMVAGSVISLIRMPSNEEATGNSNNTLLLIKFCVHVLGQIIVHFMVILVIGAKINNEWCDVNDENGCILERDECGSAMMNNLSESMGVGSVLLMLYSIDMNSAEFEHGSTAMYDKPGVTEIQKESCINALPSPFLITAIVLGGILPLAGVLAFFAVNYYWMKEFSIGFWLNMISLLKGESFAEAVFGGEGASASKEKALKFVEKSQYKKVKKQLKQFRAPPVWKKFFFPACVPRAAIGGLVYYAILACFAACLMLMYECKEVKLAVFADDPIMTGVFVISILTMVLANIHLLVLFNLILLMVAAILAFIAAVILAVRYVFDPTDL